MARAWPAHGKASGHAALRRGTTHIQPKPQQSALLYSLRHDCTLGKLGVLASRRHIGTLATHAQLSARRACTGTTLVALSRMSSIATRAAPAGPSVAAAAVGHLAWSVSHITNLLSRVSYLFLVLSPLAVTGPLVFSAHSWLCAHDGSRLARLARGATHALAEAWWDYFNWAMQACGPTFVKAMQWAAARPDLFPKALCDRLVHVHELVHVHPWSYTEQALSKALGDGWQRFLEIAPTPIGSGCIATVYRGRLLEQPQTPRKRVWLRKLRRLPDDEVQPGTDVAVKVLHPRVRQQVRGSLLPPPRATNAAPLHVAPRTDAGPGRPPPPRHPGRRPQAHPRRLVPRAV